MKEVWDLDFNGEGDAGLSFSFNCDCGEKIYVAEHPWSNDFGNCSTCGNQWELILKAMKRDG